MPRVNLCANPHADVDTTGWTSNGSISRVSATGFPKAHAVESSVAVGLLWTAAGAATPGTEYTISAKIKNVSALGTANPFIEWRDSGGSALSYSAGTPTTCPAGVVTDVSATGTAPANTVTAALLIGNMSGIRQVAAVLIEPAATPSAYADGDTSGWAWDGTTGLSASRESSNTGVLAGSLPALSALGGQFVGPVSGALAGALPALGAIATVRPVIARYRAHAPTRAGRVHAHAATRATRYRVGAVT